MSSEIDALDVGESRITTAQAHGPLRVLSLTGGGYRGLFTARSLVCLGQAARQTGALNNAIDVFAGTSIGGIMACALAVGVIPHRVLDAIDAHGPTIFQEKSASTLRRALFGALYDTDHLSKAIDAALGPHASTRLSNLSHGLLVPAIDWSKGCVHIFMSAYFGKAHASDATLKEVCLATSAAPTYFEPAQVNGAPMLDGGLAANNPDVLAVLEILRRFPDVLHRVEILSIGTAGFEAHRAPSKAGRSGLGWAPDLPTFMIDVQERTAAAQAKSLLGPRYLRVNHPGEPQAAFTQLDAATPGAREALMRAADDAAKDAYALSGVFIDRMFNPGRAAVH